MVHTVLLELHICLHLKCILRNAFHTFLKKFVSYVHELNLAYLMRLNSSIEISITQATKAVNIPMSKNTNQRAIFFLTRNL